MPLAAAVPRIVCSRGPPGNPPGWLFRPKPSELAYLGWGHRCYGKHPIPPVLHEGWHYFFVLAGKPNLLLNGACLPGRPGRATICHPDCSVGHTDEAGRACEIVVSIWRTPPHHSALRPAPGQTLDFFLDAAALRRIKRLFARCRDAVTTTSERKALELQAARLELDLMLLDAGERSHARSQPFRIDHAIEFLRSHLHHARPVSLLGDYLQLSSTTLKRLFLAHTGKSPREFAVALRMDWARQQLVSTQASVKEVSHTLGYRHATDFTRAFKQHFAKTPREMLQQKSA